MIYFTLFVHVLLATCGLIIGLYFGVLLHGLFQAQTSEISLYDDIYEETDSYEEEPEDDYIVYQEMEEEEETSEENPKENKKSTLASKIYDKSESWTDFNCSIDGQENADVISSNRNTQDDSYNIIRKKMH